LTLDEAERELEAAFDELAEALDTLPEQEAADLSAAVQARFVIESAALPGPVSRAG
jgi:DNA-binding ferritin-like protein